MAQKKSPKAPPPQPPPQPPVGIDPFGQRKPHPPRSQMIPFDMPPPQQPQRPLPPAPEPDMFMKLLMQLLGR